MTTPLTSDPYLFMGFSVLFDRGYGDIRYVSELLVYTFEQKNCFICSSLLSKVKMYSHYRLSNRYYKRSK